MHQQIPQYVNPNIRYAQYNQPMYRSQNEINYLQSNYNIPINYQMSNQEISLEKLNMPMPSPQKQYLDQQQQMYKNQGNPMSMESLNDQPQLMNTIHMMQPQMYSMANPAFGQPRNQMPWSMQNIPPPPNDIQKFHKPQQWQSYGNMMNQEMTYQEMTPNEMRQQYMLANNPPQNQQNCIFPHNIRCTMEV